MLINDKKEQKNLSLIVHFTPLHRRWIIKESDQRGRISCVNILFYNLLFVFVLLSGLSFQCL